jgi:hypothetical protein
MAWRRAFRRSGAALAVAAAVVAGAVLLAACAGTGYQYVKSSSDHTYFKVPDGWKLFDEQSIVKSLGKSLSKSQQQAALDQSWQVGFDGSSHPSLKHLGNEHADAPEGLAIVRPLSAQDADAISLQSLRNQFVDIDTAVQNNLGQIVSYDPVSLSGGFHGMHVVAELQDSKGTTSTIDQTSVVNSDTTKIYSLIVTCTSDCYDAHKSQIQNVVGSWTVRDQ